MTHKFQFQVINYIRKTAPENGTKMMVDGGKDSILGQKDSNNSQW
jgi:hypothetical protein